MRRSLPNSLPPLTHHFTTGDLTMCPTSWGGWIRTTDLPINSPNHGEGNPKSGAGLVAGAQGAEFHPIASHLTTSHRFPTEVPTAGTLDRRRMRGYLALLADLAGGEAPERDAAATDVRQPIALALALAVRRRYAALRASGHNDVRAFEAIEREFNVSARTIAYACLGARVDERRVA